MISYTPADSIYFEQNKEYCEEILSNVKALGGICKGNCDSYGYNLKAEFREYGLHFSFTYVQEHRSPGEGYSFHDAVKYKENDVYIDGFDPSKQFSLLKHKWWKSFFSNSKRIGKNYRLKSKCANTENFIQAYQPFLNDLSPNFIKLKLGKLHIESHQNLPVNSMIELAGVTNLLIQDNML